MNEFEDEIIHEFILESREHLASIESDLLSIEEAGADADAELLNKVFRAAHSIKGGAGFLDLVRIKELAHKVESILDKVRAKEMLPSAEVVNILLLAFDRLKELVENHRGSNQADISDISVALTGLLSSFLEPGRKEELNEQVPIGDADAAWRIEVSRYDLNQAHKRGQFVYLVELDLVADIEAAGKRPWDVIRELNETGDILACEVNVSAVGTLAASAPGPLQVELLYATILDPDFIGGLFEGIAPERLRLIQDPNADDAANKPASVAQDAREDAPSPAATAAPLSKAPEPAGKAVRLQREEAQEPSEASSRTEDTLRVSVSLLDNLMNLAGEMVLARNQLQTAIAQHDQALLDNAGQRMHMVTSELQETIMHTRMQPLGNVLNKFNRVVRDLARSCGKEIHLGISGKEVELDKAIIESINDPLTHMVRNAVDHGIESPEVRHAAGKPPRGHLYLSAAHSAGHVIIELGDDGKGIDPEKIAASAVRKGQISEEKASAMSQREKLELIFLPGLSTAEKLTDLSGRGVGMDVVKTNIDRLGGKVEIESEVGKGSLFRIHLPLTLAIMPGLLIEQSGQVYVVSQAHVGELIQVPVEGQASMTGDIGNHRAFYYRGKWIPIVSLAQVLGEAAQEAPASALNLLIVANGNLTYALAVDRMLQTQEVVVRPLGRHLQDCRTFAGATVLGDGRISIILDIAGIADVAEIGSMPEEALKGEAAADEAAGLDGAEVALLVFHHGENEPCAIPLDAVARIEEVAASRISRRGGVLAMQYGKRHLPLVSLHDLSDDAPLPGAETYAVMVMAAQQGEFGLIGHFPVDVYRVVMDIDLTHQQRGIAGSLIVNERTTLLVDVAMLASYVHRDKLSGALPAPVVHGAAAQAPAHATLTEQARILVAEDSGYFRTVLRELLEGAGYAVTMAENGALALESLKRDPEAVDLLVTDIEMPEMNGLELARNVRLLRTPEQLPIIAVTTLADEEDSARGQAAGIDEYQIKLDPEALLEAVRRNLSRD
jgi:two-component system chemotaxis sensor kinase CheA